jgi:putative peptidoglycan binding protein
MESRSRFLSFAVVILLISATAGAQSKTSGSKASGSKTSAKSSSSSKTPTKAKTPARRTPSRSARRRAPAVPAVQSHPDQDRYAEIQRALVDAGYDPGGTDGVWGDASAKALQQFQQDQDLDPSGKIDALTLIRLDLGPKYDSPESVEDSADEGRSDSAAPQRAADTAQDRAAAPARSVITSTN